MGPFSWPCYITGECINYLAMNIKAIKTEALLGSKESKRNLQVIHLTHLQLLPILEKKKSRNPSEYTQNTLKICRKYPTKKSKNDMLQTIPPNLGHDVGSGNGVQPGLLMEKPIIRCPTTYSRFEMAITWWNPHVGEIHPCWVYDYTELVKRLPSGKRFHNYGKSHFYG